MNLSLNSFICNIDGSLMWHFFSLRMMVLCLRRLMLFILLYGCIGYPILTGSTDFFKTTWLFLLGLLVVIIYFRKVIDGLSGWMLPLCVYVIVQLSQTSGERAAAWAYVLSLIGFAYLLSREDMLARRILYWIVACSVVIGCVKVYVTCFFVFATRSSNGINVNVYGVNCAFLYAIMMVACVDGVLSRFERGLVWVGAFAANFCVIMSGSRAAVFAVISISLLMIINAFRSNFSVRGFVAQILLSSVGWGVAFWSERSVRLIGDLNAVIVGSSATVPNARVEFWKSAWHLIVQKPLEGYGENAWFPTLHALQLNMKFPSSVTVLGHAHNEVLNAAFCYGVPFAIFYMLMLWYYGSSGLKCMRAGTDVGGLMPLMVTTVTICYGMFEVVFWHAWCIRLNAALAFVPLVVLMVSRREPIR